MKKSGRKKKMNKEYHEFIINTNNPEYILDILDVIYQKKYGKKYECEDILKSDLLNQQLKDIVSLSIDITYKNTPTINNGGNK